MAAVRRRDRGPQQVHQHENTNLSVLYRILVRFDDSTTGNINIMRNQLFVVGNPNIELDYPSIEVFQIQTRRREEVIRFLLQCGREVQCRDVRFTGDWDFFLPDANEQDIPSSLYLDIPDQYRSGIDDLQQQMIYIASLYEWNVANEQANEQDGVQQADYIPRVRLCDINNQNFGMLTDEISRVENLPFVGLITQVTAEGGGIDMPIVTLQPPYSRRGGPHKNLRGGPSNQNVWP